MRRTGTGLLFIGVLMSGCAGHPANPLSFPPNAVVVYAQPGQTVKEAVDSLPPAGGVVVLGIGSWTSGYLSGAFISKPHITIRGLGMPGYNSDFTAMAGGTIVLGPLAASSGADYFTVQDLGVDAGQAYINANNGASPTDALLIYNNGQVIGAPPVQSPLIENVSCLGYSSMAPVHCMLVENVNNAYIHNVVAVLNCHGLALKGTNSRVDGVFSRGHGITSVIVKSDAYAPSSHDTLSNITIVPLFSTGDTRGVSVIGVGAAISDITVSNATIWYPLSWGVHVQGSSATSSATGLTFSDISVDYPGGSPAADYCMVFVQYASGVNINDLRCASMWAGIASILPVSGAFDDYTVRNSKFGNIPTNAIETYGGWSISGSSFLSLRGNGIANPFGVTTVCGNTFTGIGGSDMLSMGGTFEGCGDP